MSKPKPPQPVKLVVSVITGDKGLFDTICEKLVERFGEIDYISETLPFDFTDYYEKELGKDLFRHIISFKDLISPDRLSQIKRYTNDLEDQFLKEWGNRSVNIDPGYIALCHFVLASCKGFAHRPYLVDGVYADLTLVFRKKTFQALEWTFPDYASKKLIDILNGLRSDYYKLLKEMGETEKC